MRIENTLIKAIEFDENQGALLFKGIRYLLMRPETIIEFQKGVEEVFGERAGEIFFAGGFQGGSLSAQKLKELQGLDAKGVIESMCSMGTQLGWGRFTLREFDQATYKITVEITSSPYAQIYGKSKKPVCHLIRGVIAGITKVIFGKERDVQETQCLAQGFASCIFKTN
jgi:predicted hydrocarbon binding protein